MPTEELHGAYNFLLEIAGATDDAKTVIGGFKSVSGLDSETEIVEVKDKQDGVIHKKPGRTTYGNITLERGYINTDELWQWRRNIESDIVDRRSGSIIVVDKRFGTEVARYNFYEGWPCKWYVPELDADASTVAIEKIELAVERFERAK